NFEIKNVPKKVNETKEDLIEMVNCLSKSVGTSIAVSDIKDIYRVRGKREDISNTPIVVETSSAIFKTDLLKMCKNYNVKHKSKLCAKHLGFRTSEDTPIFVSEQLTPKGARLYFLARELVRTKAYRFCWTAYGKVFVRKDENSPIITIKNETQISYLLKKN
ncbi:jg23165, partial [Pararge aegeria aegeria]